MNYPLKFNMRYTLMTNSREKGKRKMTRIEESTKRIPAQQLLAMPVGGASSASEKPPAEVSIGECRESTGR